MISRQPNLTTGTQRQKAALAGSTMQAVNNRSSPTLETHSLSLSLSFSRALHLLFICRLVWKTSKTPHKAMLELFFYISLQSGLCYDNLPRPWTIKSRAECNRNTQPEAYNSLELLQTSNSCDQSRFVKKCSIIVGMTGWVPWRFWAG